MLESLITSETRRQILSLFFTNPKDRFYLREVGRKINQPTNAVSAELAKLEKAGILTSERQANLLYYTTNSSCPIYSELKSIILKTDGLGGQLRAALVKSNGIHFAFIFGSYAKGLERPGSDIDIMLIGSIKPAAIAPVIKRLEARIGREVNYSIYPEEEFLRTKSKGFLSDVIHGQKIMLVGDLDEFERFVEGGKGAKSRA